jgi:hypothetical protein
MIATKRAIFQSVASMYVLVVYLCMRLVLIAE